MPRDTSVTDDARAAPVNAPTCRPSRSPRTGPPRSGCTPGPITRRSTPPNERTEMPPAVARLALLVPPARQDLVDEVLDRIGHRDPGRFNRGDSASAQRASLRTDVRSRVEDRGPATYAAQDRPTPGHSASDGR